MATESVGNAEILKFYEIIDTVVKIGLGALITGVFSLFNNLHQKSENKKSRKQEITIRNNERFYIGYSHIFELFNELSIEIKLYYHEGWNLFYKMKEREDVDERFGNFVGTHDDFLLKYKKLINKIKIQLHLLTIDNFDDHIKAIETTETKMIDVFALKTKVFFEENYRKDDDEKIDFGRLLFNKKALLDKEIEKLLKLVNDNYVEFIQ